MSITELQSILYTLLAQHGDIQICVLDDDGNYPRPAQDVEHSEAYFTSGNNPPGVEREFILIS